MQRKLTQIRSAPAVAGDGKLPAALIDSSLPLYTKAMEAVDKQEIALRTKNRRETLSAHAAITGTVRLIQAELCYEYSPIRARRDCPDMWDVICFSGNLGRPLQHDFCADCVFFDTNNTPVLSKPGVLVAAAKKAVA
jgi:hypothetical protein